MKPQAPANDEDAPKQEPEEVAPSAAELAAAALQAAKTGAPIGGLPKLAPVSGTRLAPVGGAVSSADPRFHG